MKNNQLIKKIIFKLKHTTDDEVLIARFFLQLSLLGLSLLPGMGFVCAIVLIEMFIQFIHEQYTKRYAQKSQASDLLL